MAELALNECFFDVCGGRKAGTERVAREVEAAGAFGQVAPDAGRHGGQLHEPRDVLVRTGARPRRRHSPPEEVTAVYDGIWRKPHNPTFIKDVTVEETQAALTKAGHTAELMPIPLTVFVLKIGDRYIMCDAGSGVGQWQANATNLPGNMKAADIDYTKIGTVLISHSTPITSGD